MSDRDLPYQHLSIRVPWHDTGWDGRVCADPIGNSSCLRLRQVAERRDDASEAELAGKTWDQIEPEQLPPCADERAGFMSSRPRVVSKEHPYSSWNQVYSKFGKATYELPAFAADCIPFRWMLREEAAGIAEHYSLSYRAELEDQVDQEAGTNPIWVQHGDNQTLMLDSFFSSIKPERSLVFFYAQESPLTNDPRRLLIGVGRAESVGSVVPYEQTGDGFGSVIWQRVVRHSIRPDILEDGFLLPYHKLLEDADNYGRDLSDLAVFVPDEYRLQFSYASEHVRHDASIELLRLVDRAIKRFVPLVTGHWDGAKSWVNDRLNEVWQARGPCPGLGVALKAFGIDEGALLAYAAQSRLGDNEDPWPLIDQWLRDPTMEPEVSSRVGRTMSKVWAVLPEERRSLLKLLSRFDVSPEQATRIYQETERNKAGISLSDNDILSNPYLIYEANRLEAEPVAVSVIDRGVFPADQIRAAHPLPELSVVEEDIDPRRVRALVLDVLEEATVSGHSLQSQSSVIQRIRDRPLAPSCPLSMDIMAVCEEDLLLAVAKVQMANGEPAYQLQRLNEAKNEISLQIDRWRKDEPLSVDADWRAVIDEQLREFGPAEDEEEELARQEKAAALEILATSRFSVLVGAAGTGKTTLLRALTRLPGVSDGGLLLLAPTGKSRVRMQEAIGHEAKTLAQFLLKQNRYDLETGRYHRSGHDHRKSARTVIVDECSMLTEEMLDALFDSLVNVNRFVLVGDPRQLPPIGVGRPFVDIVEYLRHENGVIGFPRVADSYAELTIPRRQIAASGTSGRADLLFAEWFSGEEPSLASDNVWDSLMSRKDLGTISVRQWNSLNDLHKLLCEEIESQSPDGIYPADPVGFNQSYGGQVSGNGNYVEFNSELATGAETWQVISPVRGAKSGINELNRMLQQNYRSLELQHARRPKYRRNISKSAGLQGIIYGDKVINIRNKDNRKNYHRDNGKGSGYVANGEIGFVTGPVGRKNPYLDRVVNVAFSTQPGLSYEYRMADLDSEKGEPFLELAYAITIHRSQGSEFKRTFVIIPNPCRLLSRELLYTALTRQQEHVVVFYQGDLFDLRKFSSSSHSVTAARQTNLFLDPKPIESTDSLRS